MKLFSVFISLMMFVCNIQVVHANEGTYAHSDSATSGGVTLNVEWDEPVLGQAITFHVSATGGSGHYKFNMEAPSYTNPDTLSYESVADPSRGEWTKYTKECSSQDYTFTMMASGTYNFRFHVMDIEAGVTYLRTNTYIQVSSPDFPSVNSIVQSAVNKCNSETDGSDYAKALWLHDWLLEQLDYDNALKWSSAESALTRGLGTCQAYERAYSKLLTAAGIENAETRDTYDGHTWNAMKIDGKWYQVDCTWDDSNENYYDFNRTHLYFGLSDELMAIAHQGHKNIYTAQGYSTSSISLDSNYFIQSGDAKKWADLYKGRIQENLNAGHTEFSLTADNATYPPSIYGIQNGIIAYAINKIDWFVNGKKVNLVAKTNDKQFDFTATYSNVDSEAPVIDISTINFSKDTATTGDTVKVSVKITDNIGITKSVVILVNYETGKRIHLQNSTYNENKDVYEYSMNIDENVPNGHWYIEGIQARDAADNLGIETFNQNEYAFIVSGTKVDSEAPMIDVSSINFSKDTATTGDTVKVSVKITDNIGITKSVVILVNYETGKRIHLQNSTYNENKDVYEYSMNIDENVPNGHWYIEGIQARDVADNLGIETFNQNEYAFIVSGTKADSEAPVIDVSTINFSKDTATTGDTVKVSVKITDNTGITSSVVILVNYETGKRIHLQNSTYNKNKDVYEYSMNIDENVPNGHWYIEGIQARDAADNLGIETFNQNVHLFIVGRNNVDVHKWNDGVISKHPTCTEKGEKTFECSVCHKTKTEVIKPLGHNYSLEWTIDKEATCTESGSKSHHCSRCDSKKDVTEIAKKGHNWDSGVVTSEATCTHDGVKTYTCKDCKLTKTEVIKALGHDYSSEWTIDKEATCTESGSKSHHCSRCDSKKDVTSISKMDHIWVVESSDSVHSGKDKEVIYRCSHCKEIRKDVFTGSWQNNSNGMMYIYSDGSYENSGFKVIDNKTYYFQNNGVVKTDWLLEDNAWYYFNKDGIMQTGWSGPGRQFYFDDGGKMLEKQFTPDGYYVGSSGAYVRNGWVLENGQYYYMNSAGRMVKSAWVGAYYLDSNGVMVTNSWVNNYWCGNDGAYVKNKWIQWHGNYYYLDSNGVCVRNKWIGAYYLGSNGAMATNCWVGNYWCGSDGKYVKNAWVDNNRYYVGSNGLYVPGKWQKDSKGWWYQVGNTYAKNITLNIGGTSYTFDSNGYMA